MSVINKMLRDLDHRQATQTPLSAGIPAGTSAPLRQGTTSIGQPTRTPRSQPRRWIWMVVAGLVAAVGASAWIWMQPGSGAMHFGTASAPGPAMAASSGAPKAVAAPTTTAILSVADTGRTPRETNAAPGPMVLRMENTLSARRALDALLSTPAPSTPAVVTTPTVAPAAARERPKTAVDLATPPVAPKEPAPATTRAPTASLQTDTAPMMQRQQQAGAEAIAQAQNLWNTGSHDAAIDLMQQSIAAAERAAKAGSAANAGLVLIPLAREMARMQLAEGRFGAVWEMLTRLEPQLGNQPDLWAIRANAAQRLGHHQDSVHAYMVALQSRPDEQRWLLGMAVSLAALGQTSSATEMAEKARAVGPVSKDILAYLRQAGVVLRD